MEKENLFEWGDSFIRIFESALESQIQWVSRLFSFFFLIFLIYTDVGNYKS